MRLSPRSVPLRVAQNGGRIVFFAVVGLASGGGRLPRPTVVAGFLLVGAAVVSAWQVAYVRRFEYELTADTLDIQSGVLSRREREIPYDRVQNVDVAQTLLGRLLGVAEVRVETAGGGDSEARLRYVARGEADRLRSELGRRTRGAEAGAEGTDEPVAERLFALADRELAVLGLVSADLRVLGLVSVGLSAAAPGLADRLQPGPDLVALAGPTLALVGLAGLCALSAATVVVRYYGFELSQAGEELRYERGLLQRYSGTIPTGKVQSLRLRENVLARALGYAGLVVETAGYGPDQEGGAQSAVPLAERDRALALAREVEPFGAVEFERPPKRARTRYAVRYALLVAAGTGLLGAVDALTGWVPVWPLSAGAVALVPVAAHLAWVHRGYHFGEEYLVTRNGFWRRETVVVPYDRVQTVRSSQSVFQRRRALGTVTVDTASTGGLFGTAASAVDVDAGLAERLREDIAERFRASLAG